MNRNEGVGILTVFLVVIGILASIGLGIWFIRVQFAEEIGRGNAEIQLENANSRIPRYEEFYDLCVSVQNAEAGINAEAHRLNTTEDEGQKRIIEQNIAGLNASRARGVNQYNANASKYYTDGRFQGENLPERLSSEPYVPGTNMTNCEN